MRLEMTDIIDTPPPYFAEVFAPAYADAGGAAIRCFVRIDAKSRAVPFLATATDTEAHGAELFAELVAGKHGPVAPYAPPLLADVQAALSGAVQAHLDAAARAFGYDSIASAVSYADEPSVPAFQSQGKALRAWRSQVWASCIATLDAVKAGSQPVPTAEAFVATLPVAPSA